MVSVTSAVILGAVVAVAVPLIRLAQRALLLRFLTSQLERAEDAARTEVCVLVARQLTSAGASNIELTPSAPPRSQSPPQ